MEAARALAIDVIDDRTETHGRRVCCERRDLPRGARLRLRQASAAVGSLATRMTFLLLGDIIGSKSLHGLVGSIYPRNR